MRKRLGLLMLLSASLHACFYLLLFSEKHEPSWRTSSYLLAGVLGYCLAVMLGLASLPGIEAVLSWREFRR